jgi:hypothetical protein
MRAYSWNFVLQCVSLEEESFNGEEAQHLAISQNAKMKGLLRE